MTEQKKLPSELEENIQNLAGDIYLQIEDKITALITSYSDNLAVTTEQVEQHPNYQQLKAEYENLAKNCDDKSHAHHNEVNDLLGKNKQLQSQVDLQQHELENHAKLNTAKLTDTEQVLKEKLQENSQLTEQLGKLNAKLTEQQGGLDKFQQDHNSLSQQLSALQTEHNNLGKTDKAKAATISVQNQKISELQLKHEQVASELELLKAQQEQALQSTNEHLTSEKKQAELLLTQRQQLESDVKKQDEKVAQLARKNTELIADIQRQKEAQKIQHGELTQLNEKYSNIVNENKALQLEITKLEAEQVAQNSVIDEQKRQVSSEKSHVSQLQSDIKAREKDIAQQRTENQDLVKKAQQQATTQQQELENLQLNHEKSIADLEKELTKQKQNTESLSEKNQQKVEQQQQELENLEKNHKKLVDKLNEDITNFRDKEQLSVQRLAELEQQITENTDNNKLLAEQNKQLEVKYQQDIQKLQANHQQITADFEQTINDKNTALSKLQQQADSQVKALEEKINQQTILLTEHVEQLTESKSAYQKLAADNENITKQASDLEQKTGHLEQQLQAEKSAAIKNRQMIQESKSKQELEYNKARETIKYLRDENTDLNHKLEQQVNELEDKLTEYRLRFEYAQKQLTKMSK